MQALPRRRRQLDPKRLQHETDQHDDGNGQLDEQDAFARDDGDRDDSHDGKQQQQDAGDVEVAEQREHTELEFVAGRAARRVLLEPGHEVVKLLLCEGHGLHRHRCARWRYCPHEAGKVACRVRNIGEYTSVIPLNSAA
jgi:hypothetical protein